MTQEEPLREVWAELGALRTQMRQLLATMAEVQQQAGGVRQAPPPRESGAAAAEQAAPRAQSSPPASRQEVRPGAGGEAGTTRQEGRAEADAGTAQQQQPAGTELALEPLYAENERLVDLLRAQAEELGALRERVRQLEVARPRPRDPVAASLRALLQALHEEPAPSS